MLLSKSGKRCCVLKAIVQFCMLNIDWDSDEQHIAAYEKYYFDEKFRKECAQKGLERAKMFSWEKTVQNIIDRMNERNAKV